MIPKCAVATVSLLGVAWGCAANPDTTAGLASISPAMAFNDYPSPVQIRGDHLRPAFRFDTMAGAASPEEDAFSVSLTATGGGSSAVADAIRLDGVTWRSPDELGATVPAGVPAGTYDVTVTDPRGHAVVLGGSFVSLGPDRQPPAVSILSPDLREIIGAGTMVQVLVMADDGVGFLGSFTLNVSAPGISEDVPCQVPPDAHVWQCPFTFAAPVPASDMDAVTISAMATDNVGNQTPVDHMFPLAPRPTVTGLSLALGPSGGGTRTEVYGTDFVKPTGTSDGTVLLLAGEVVTSADVLSPTEITAVMPAHDPGPTRLTVRTGYIESNGTSFLFVAAPKVLAVSPTHGPTTGGTPIVIVGKYFRSPATQISFDSGRMMPEGMRFVSTNRIEGILPPGAAGPVTVTAFDPIGGIGPLPAGFTYDPVESNPPDGGADSTDAGAP